MRPHGGADDVERVRRVATPVADGFVRGVLQRLVAALHGVNLRAQHLHAFHVNVLPLHVRRAHIDPARHVHQGADGGCGHTVLPRARFGDDAFLAHGPRQEDLPEGVVDLVCSGVVQVFALQVEPAAVFLAHAPGKVEGRRPPHVVFQQRVELLLERLAFENGQISLPQVLHRLVENLRHVGSAEVSIIPFRVHVKSFHCFEMFMVCDYGHKKRRPVVSTTGLRVYLLLYGIHIRDLLLTTFAVLSCATTNMYSCSSTLSFCLLFTVSVCKYMEILLICKQNRSFFVAI